MSAPVDDRERRGWVLVAQDLQDTRDQRDRLQLDLLHMERERDALRAQVADATQAAMGYRLESEAARAEVERMRAERATLHDVSICVASRDTVSRRAEQMAALARRLAEALVDTLGSYFRCTVCHATSSAKGCREFNGVWREYDPFYVHEEDCELSAALREAREAGVVE